MSGDSPLPTALSNRRLGSLNVTADSAAHGALGDGLSALEAVNVVDTGIAACGTAVIRLVVIQFPNPLGAVRRAVLAGIRVQRRRRGVAISASITIGAAAGVAHDIE